MTPTEQDKELKELVDNFIYDIAVLRPYTRVTKEAKRRLMQLITQYGDTREREGRESVERDHRCPRPVSRGNKTYGAGI